MFRVEVEAGMTVKTLGQTLTIGDNCDVAKGDWSFWLIIKDRELAIDTLKHECDKGAPHIVLRVNSGYMKEEDLRKAVYPHRIIYQIGGVGRTQDNGEEMPFGFAGIYIDTELGEKLLAEGILWLYCDVDNPQVHSYYTGPGSYYEKNEHLIVPHTERVTTEKRAQVLENHVLARCKENPRADTDTLVKLVKEQYPLFNGFYFPTDDTIRDCIEVKKATN